MARTTRTNHAKVKVWMQNMTSEVEGTIAGVAIEVFRAIESPTARAKALEQINAHHAKLLAQEKPAALPAN
jgi:hypothetical protein